MKLLRPGWLPLALLAGMVLGGCAKTPPTPPGTPPGKAPGAGKEPYVIGAMFAVTGDASALGVPEKNSATMLEKKLNAEGGIDGHPVKIVIEDTKGEPTEAVNAIKRLVEKDKVLAVVGPTRTGETMAVVDYADQAGVPLVSCALGIEIVQPVKKWVFKTPASDRSAVEKIAEYLKAKKITQVATLTDNTGFGKSGLKELQAGLPAAGIKLVATEEFGPKDPSMETQVTKIKGSRAQAVVCWGTAQGPGIVARNMKQLSLKIPLICSQGVASDKFLEVAGAAANGTVVIANRLLVRDQIPDTDPQKKVLLQFADDYQKDVGAAPDVFSGHAWDAIQLVAQALRTAGPDRAKLRDQLELTTGFVGIDGLFNFSATDHCGLTKDAFVVIQVQDGKWKLQP